MNAEIAETHSAVVFFMGDRAYKVKKAVDLGFLDFRTREAREVTCHREVELNRRLSPDVYLGVADVTDADGVLCDHLVVMRRMPAQRRLSALIAAGEDVDECLNEIARVLAAFHARQPSSAAADEAAGVQSTGSRWSSNTEALLAAGAVFDADAVDDVQRLADQYLDGRGPLFTARIAAGRAADGHGDLLTDDIFCLDDGPRILDCIEFDDSLRAGDVLADVAFLAMDLERLGRPDLAGRFLDAYRERSGDAWPSSLAHHQIAYRAQVRAKTTAIRSVQGDPGAADGARRLLELTRSHLDAGRVRLIVVGGMPGTGKSTLARGLADRLEATVLRSDEIRKELAGIDTLQDAAAAVGEGIYTPAMSRRTYATMLDRARVALGMGESVVLDASWSSGGRRREARKVAGACSAEITEIRCDAPESLAAHRMHRRHQLGGDPSDATPDVAATMAAAFDAWPQAHVVDTRGEPRESIESALALV